MRIIKGFSLFELIIVMLITGIIMSGVSLLMSAGFDSYFEGVQNTTLTSQAIVAMNRMSEEIQQADSNSFTTITPSSMTFTTMSGSTITYNYSNSTLTRNNKILATQVTSLVFKYYSSLTTEITTPPGVIKAVTISMTLQYQKESIPLINTIFINN